MSFSWHDNEPAGYISWGISTAGLDGSGPLAGTEGEAYTFPGQALLLLTSVNQRFCRPPAGSGHFLWHEVAFFDAGLTFLGLFDLYDHDYLMTTYTYGGFVYPTDWYDVDLVDYVTPSFTAHTGVTTGPFPTAVWYLVNIRDEGPYDSTGTTTAAHTSDYSPYTDGDTAMANAFACGGANLTGARGTDRVYFS